MHQILALVRLNVFGPALRAHIVTAATPNIGPFLLGECPLGILIAADFGKHTATAAAENGIRLVRYKLQSDAMRALTFEEIYQGMTLEPLS
jgi:hypothetical protein